jgi:hypothetical protein
MSIRTRKFIGAVVILAFVVIYSLVVMVIAQGRIQDAPRWGQAIFYLVAGLAWTLPLMPLIRWMEKRPQS